jgi:hypothetical protein
VSATLTLSAIERAAVLRHLELQFGRLPAGHLDGVILNKLLVLVGEHTTIAVTRLEVFVMLRHLRVQRFKMEHDMAAIEERRLRGGIDGELDLAHRTLDAEVTILADVIRRLWDLL